MVQNKSIKPFHLNVIVNRRFGAFGREQVALSKLEDEERIMALRVVIDGECENDSIEVMVVGTTDYGQRILQLDGLTDDELLKVMCAITNGAD